MAQTKDDVRACISARIGTHNRTAGPSRDYRVTVFKALKSGDLYALVLRVTVSQTIEWVRANVDEIVAIGIRNDSIARNAKLPVVALNVQEVCTA